MDFRSKTAEGDQLGDLCNIQVTDNEGLNKGDDILVEAKGAGWCQVHSGSKVIRTFCV